LILRYACYIIQVLISTGLKITCNKYMIKVKLKKQKLSIKTYLIFTSAQVIVIKTMILLFVRSI
jgi:hypothetical protein